jgi:hypothetical protein
VNVNDTNWMLEHAREARYVQLVSFVFFSSNLTLTLCCRQPFQ